MSAAEEAKKLVQAAQAKHQLEEAAKAAAARRQEELARKQGIKNADERFPRLIKTIKAEAAAGRSSYNSTYSRSDSTVERAKMDRLAELLQAEGFKAEVRVQSKYTPGPGSDSFGSYECWFLLEVSWDC